MLKMRFAFKREMLPSFESQKTVTEKTTKGEAQAYSPLESPFVYAPRTMHTAAQGALLFNRRGDYQSPAFKYTKSKFNIIRNIRIVNNFFVQGFCEFYFAFRCTSYVMIYINN